MIILDVCFTSRIAAQFLHPRLVVHIFFGTSVDLGTKPTLDIDPGNTLSNQQNLPRRLWAMKKKPGYLGYMSGMKFPYPVMWWIMKHKPMEISGSQDPGTLNNQDSMKSIRPVFFWLTWSHVLNAMEMGQQFKSKNTETKAKGWQEYGTWGHLKKRLPCQGEKKILQNSISFFWREATS